MATQNPKIELECGQAHLSALKAARRVLSQEDKPYLSAEAMAEKVRARVRERAFGREGRLMNQTDQ